MVSVELKGEKELLAAISRNPQVVISETAIFFQRAMAVYRSAIFNNPWRVGGSGGGVPVSDWMAKRRGSAGNLRQSHVVEYQQFQASIGPGRAYPVGYAGYVHEGTKKMAKRPWLDNAKRTGESAVRGHWQTLLQNITADLAK